MLTSFTVAVTFYDTTCKLYVDLIQRETEYRVLYRDRLVQMGPISALVPGAVTDDVSVPDRAIEFLRKRIEGMHFSCQLLHAIDERTKTT